MPRKKVEPSRIALMDINSKETLHKKEIPAICRRIRYYRELLGIEQKELGAKLNIVGNAVSNWENGRGRPDINLIPEICDILGITLYELFDIDDPLLRHTKREQYLLSRYRNLSDSNKYLVDNLIQSMERLGMVAEVRDVTAITLYDKPLAAGVGDPTEFEDSGEPLYLYVSDKIKGADCAFTVNGDSMEPTYSDGDIVLVKRFPKCPEPAPDEIGAFIVGNELYIKEYRNDGLYSHNADYAPMHFDEHEHVFFIGRVIDTVNDEDIASQSDIDKYFLMNENE